MPWRLICTPKQLEYLGAVEGLRSWIKDFGRHQSLKIDFTADLRRSMPPEIGVTFFRVLQESAAKHRQAQWRKVGLKFNTRGFQSSLPGHQRFRQGFRCRSSIASQRFGSHQHA